MQPERLAAIPGITYKYIFIFAAHQVGGNNRGMSCTVGMAGDEWSTLASPPSTRPPKGAGVGEAVVPAAPILVLLVVQRLTSACVTSEDWGLLCYLCWTMKMG